MNHFANATFYTLCEAGRGVLWMNGASRKSIIRHNNQRDSSNMPCGFDDRQAMETRGKVPARKRLTFDPRGPRLLRCGLARLARLRRQTRLAGRLGNYPARSADLPPHAPAAGGLSGRDSAHPRAGTFDAGTAHANRVARVDRRGTRLATSQGIKSIMEVPC